MQYCTLSFTLKLNGSCKFPIQSWPTHLRDMEIFPDQTGRYTLHPLDYIQLQLDSHIREDIESRTFQLDTLYEKRK